MDRRGGKVLGRGRQSYSGSRRRKELPRSGFHSAIRSDSLRRKRRNSLNSRVNDSESHDRRKQHSDKRRINVRSPPFLERKRERTDFVPENRLYHLSDHNEFGSHNTCNVGEIEYESYSQMNETFPQNINFSSSIIPSTDYRQLEHHQIEFMDQKAQMQMQFYNEECRRIANVHSPVHGSHSHFDRSAKRSTNEYVMPSENQHQSQRNFLPEIWEGMYYRNQTEQVKNSREELYRKENYQKQNEYSIASNEPPNVSLSDGRMNDFFSYRTNLPKPPYLNDPTGNPPEYPENSNDDLTRNAPPLSTAQLSRARELLQELLRTVSATDSAHNQTDSTMLGAVTQVIENRMQGFPHSQQMHMKTYCNAVEYNENPPQVFENYQVNDRERSMRVERIEKNDQRRRGIYHSEIDSHRLEMRRSRSRSRNLEDSRFFPKQSMKESEQRSSRDSRGYNRKFKQPSHEIRHNSTIRRRSERRRFSVERR